MESYYPENEIDKRRRRATKLGVDDLICSLFLEAGLRNYASWSQDPDWVCPSISEVRVSPQGGSLGFTLKGQRFSIHTEENHLHSPSDPDTTRIDLNLLLDGELVFGAEIEHRTIEDLDFYSPEWVTEFIEGDWIKALLYLEQEMKQITKRNIQRLKRERAQKAAANFGLPIANKSGSGPGSLKRILRRMVLGWH